MECTLLSPLKKRVLTIEWLDITTDVGNFVIQKGHAPTLLVATPGTSLVVAFKDGRQENIEISGTAIVHIMRDGITILLSE
jgi:F0F1-type ATP synthase epsilon subunit